MFVIPVNDDWRRYLREIDVSNYEGGWGELVRDLKAAWQRDGRNGIPIDDWQTYDRIRRYARDMATTGTFRALFRYLASQMPDDLVNPQQELFT